MADSVVRLTVNSSEYDQKLKRAAEGLTRYADECHKVGGTLEVVEKETLDYVRAIGQMDTTSRMATGKLAEMKKAFVELSAQYKQMTDAEKASPFGKALSESLNELKPRIMEAKQQLDDINKSMIGASSSSGGGLFAGLGDKMSGALQVFAGNMLTKAAGAVASLGSEMAGMVQQGIELAKQGEGIRIAFERLGRGDILQGLREATHGTVTDLELMKAAVKFNDFKLPVEELGILLQFAQQKAKDTGQSVDYMVDSIVTGLGRKSLMILDNLGLSATEVKERMAETGDMTKAVGEIIREQMSKAGDYVETAADRATQADVKLKNAMEELGRTFQPLTDAGTSMWSSLKVGALDLLNNAVKPLIQALSEAGALGQAARASAGFNNLGGNVKVDRMIARLGNGKTHGAYSIYTQQLGKFDEYINNKRFQIAAFGNDNSSIAQSAKQKLQTELDGALKMRAEYVKRAQELHNQVPSPYDTSNTTNVGGGNKGSGKGFDMSSIAFNPTSDTSMKYDPNQYFQSIWEIIGEAGRKQIAETMDKQWDYGKDISKEWKVDSKGNLTNKPENRAQESMARDLNKFTGYAEKTLGGVSSIVGGLSQLGVEIPKGLQDVISGIQGVTSIVTGIASLVAMIEALTTVQTTESTIKSIPIIGWALAGGGIVHAAGGYEVPGNYYSGDQVPALLNSGELVLNKAQQNALANELQGNGIQNMRLRTEVSGRNLIVVIENDLKARGKGQLATFK